MNMTWEDMGFRRLARTSVPENLRRSLRELGGYDFHPPNLIRHEARVTGRKIVSDLGDLTGADASATITTIVNRFNAMVRISQEVGVNHYAASEELLSELLNNAEQEPDDARFCNSLAKAISFAGTGGNLRKLLANKVAPLFRERFPTGRIQILGVDDFSQNLVAMSKVLYTQQHCEINNAFEVCDTLRHWHSSDAQSSLLSLLTLAGFLWPPFVRSFTCGPFGTVFLFMLDPPSTVKFPPYPVHWNATLWHGSQFGGEPVDIERAAAGLETNAHRQLSHRRLLSASVPGLEEFADFTSWLITRISETIVNISDMCSFTLNQDCQEPIDHKFAFEHFLTVQRIIKRTLTVASSNHVSVTKTTTFEIADLYDTLSQRFGHTQAEAIFFKTLFNPECGKKIICDALLTIPGVGASLSDLAAEVYDLMEKTIVGSVWVPGKVRAEGVKVKKKDLSGERIEPRCEFVANVMRSYRNGHHGYFTSGDKHGKRPSRYLWLVDGHIPDAIANLPSLWLFAYLASPQIVGWKPLGFGLPKHT